MRYGFGEDAQPTWADGLFKVGEGLLTNLGVKLTGGVPTPQQVLPVQPRTDYTPFILIGGLGIAAYLLLRKK